MLCDFRAEEIEPGKWRHTCQRESCAFSIVVPRPKCKAICKVVGLGDRVAWVLNAMGIRVRKKCNCKKRQQVLNRVGEWMGI